MIDRNMIQENFVYQFEEMYDIVQVSECDKMARQVESIEVKQE
jgi:hypothetical protein